MKRAEELEKEWKYIAPVKLGGPAFNIPGNEFIPGMYVKPGCVITSRGCNNRCWFCEVWKRENGIKELEIKEGHNILDDNLLACSDNHIKSVFAMLRKQKEPIQFTGGIEAKLLKDWHVDLFNSVKIKSMFFAYDTEDDYEPLLIASKKLKESGYTRNKLYCYCLIGYPKDTFKKAEVRLKQILELGMTPFAMLYRNKDGTTNLEWRKFQRGWCRPAAIFSKSLPKNMS